MTVVAVRVFKDKIVMSCDSQGTSGNHKRSLEALGFHKIFQNNGVTVGACGNTMESGLLKIFIKSHRPKEATQDSMLDFMSEFFDWLRKKDQNMAVDGAYILVMDGKVFELSYFEANEILEYGAVGSGRYVALGAMLMGASPEKAVEAAKTFDLYCGGETHTITINLEAKK
ncbi:MAG: hypothetical protein KCHDKBKB_00754 [Elusimicrobia bacterium]|nr:hypothetical protein [Elusimicrobiota bacterium]